MLSPVRFTIFPGLYAAGGEAVPFLTGPALSRGPFTHIVGVNAFFTEPRLTSLITGTRIHFPMFAGPWISYANQISFVIQGQEVSRVFVPEPRPALLLAAGLTLALAAPTWHLARRGARRARG